MSSDYRLREVAVEFRLNAGERRNLTESDLRLHFRFNTEVARWLRSHCLEPYKGSEQCDKPGEPIYSTVAVLDFFFDFPLQSFPALH